MKKCPYCAEEIQDEAILCRYCGKELGEKKEEVVVTAKPAAKQTPEDEARAKRSTNIGLLIVTGIVVVFFIMIYMAQNQPKAPYQPNDADAFYMCKQFMTDRLKAPKTAEFAKMSDSVIEMADTDTFSVTSYVDSENGFGAMIRTTFNCKTYYVGSDKWKLEDLTTE